MHCLKDQRTQQRHAAHQNAAAPALCMCTYILEHELIVTFWANEHPKVPLQKTDLSMWNANQALAGSSRCRKNQIRRCACNYTRHFTTCFPTKATYAHPPRSDQHTTQNNLLLLDACAPKCCPLRSEWSHSDIESMWAKTSIMVHNIKIKDIKAMISKKQALFGIQIKLSLTLAVSFQPEKVIVTRVPVYVAPCTLNSRHLQWDLVPFINVDTTTKNAEHSKLPVMFERTHAPMPNCYVVFGCGLPGVVQYGSMHGSFGALFLSLLASILGFLEGEIPESSPVFSRFSSFWLAFGFFLFLENSLVPCWEYGLPSFPDYSSISWQGPNPQQ